MSCAWRQTELDVTQGWIQVLYVLKILHLVVDGGGFNENYGHKIRYKSKHLFRMRKYIMTMYNYKKALTP